VADEPPPRREYPQLLIGLVAIALAIAVVVPITAAIIAGAIRDVKVRRDTIVVTGSARQPIEADLGIWHLTVSAKEQTPAAAAASVRRKVKAVDAFLRQGGLTAEEIRKPPLSVEQASISVPTGKPRPAFRLVPAWLVSQPYTVTTKNLDSLEQTAAGVDSLLLQGVDVSVTHIQYVSTELTAARFEALKKATADAQRRAETIADGLSGHLGAVRKVSLGVYQIVPRNSTSVSDYGINDVTARHKDVISVVTVTFAVEH
jgi:uncharacterized protein